MKKFHLLLFLLSIYLNAFAQSLSQKRIERVDKALVRIYVDNKPSGTGFFVNKEWILSNRHVIERAIIRDSITKTVLSILPISAKIHTSDIINVEISERQLIGDENDLSIALDFVFLKIDPTQALEKNIDEKVEFLELGKWSDVEEGDLIYTSGYPLTINQRFISKGVLSTKFTSKEKLRTYKYVKNEKGEILVNDKGDLVSITTYKDRDAAWADLTVNRGNSGGPVMKYSKFPKKDKVIGITSFLLNPYYEIGELGAKHYMDLYIKNNEKGLTPNRQFSVLFESMSYSSFGIGGVISIDYASSILEQLNRKQ